MSEQAVNWFVEDGTTSIPVEGFGFVDVKTDLSHAERQRLVSAMMGTRKADGEWQADLERLDIERILSWCTGWNAVDRDGKRVPFTRAAVAALSSPAAVALIAALDAHVGRIEAERGKVTSNGHAPLPIKAAGRSRRTSPSASG